MSALQTSMNSIANALLWPGDVAAGALNITDPDGRMLFRMFVNVSVYGKLAVLVALMFI